jgi:two-component system, NarL family, response regulator NreC
MTIRILIADDHAVVAEGLRSLINAQSDMEVVGIAGNGREAVAQTLETQPDVVIMDNAMPELNGIEAARIISKKCAQTRIVMLSMHSTSVHVYRALQAGACGYVMKESVGRELVNAIRTVHAGHRYLSKPLAEDMLDRLVSNAPEDPLSRLSTREREVLQLIAEGNSIVDIAGKLSLSRKTVETYRERMMEKLGLNDFAGLIKFAIQHDVISLD